MKYLEVKFNITPYDDTAADILSAMAAEAGFETFINEEDGLKGYVQTDLLDEGVLKSAIDNFPLEDVDIKYVVTEADNRNWNETWEKESFKPVVCGNCCIHGSHHTEFPAAEYEIIINPRMAFGSGNHVTTRNLLITLQSMELDGMSVLDMGCGTSVLGIMAAMRGASRITGVDIDEWSVENSIINVRLNGMSEKMDIHLGDASILPSLGTFDLIIANINRNILLNDMATYVSRLNRGGQLLMSGFYSEDVESIASHGSELGLNLVEVREDEGWAVVRLR